MEQRKRERLTSIAIHSVVLAALAGLLIFLCFKDSNGQYYDLLINKSLSKTLNGNWAKTAFAFIFSIIAEYPAYFILPIFAVMLFYSDDLLPAKWRIPFKILMAALSVGGWVILCCKSEVADMIQDTGFDGIKFDGSACAVRGGIGIVSRQIHTQENKIRSIQIRNICNHVSYDFVGCKLWNEVYLA